MNTSKTPPLRTDGLPPAAAGTTGGRLPAGFPGSRLPGAV
jgi:hypothetical protein